MCIRSRDWGPLCSWGPVYLLIREAWANSISFGDYLPSLVPRRYSVAGHVVTSYTCVAPGWISDFAVRDISDFFYYIIYWASELTLILKLFKFFLQSVFCIFSFEVPEELSDGVSCFEIKC